MKKIGISKHMPPSEARPLGTKRKSSTPKRAKTVGDRIAEIIEKDGFCDVTLKLVDTTSEPVVDSISEVAAIQPTESAAEQQEHHMTLTFVKNSRNGKRAIYSGAALSLAFPLALFVDKTAPATITDLSAFAEKVAKTPRAALTPEEKAARKANRVVPTLAEKIARREALLAKDKAKLAAMSQM